MLRFVLDTDTFSLFLRGHSQVTANVLGRPLAETGTTIITVEEELSGWYTTLRKAKSPVSLATAYRRMTETVESLALLKLLTFTESAIARFAILRKQHPRIGRNDLRIAAIAIDNNVTLVTRNRIDFQAIEGLTIVDWSTQLL